uniref:Cathepsin propeptide inhibitor domain-containing protein n=1 Tax=Homalodisca liturata TaxID=320908 RepID=A0A1B6ICQ8_9HEMI
MAIRLIVLGLAVLAVLCPSTSSDPDPTIPTHVNLVFMGFQNAVAYKQMMDGVPNMYNDLEAYKKGFEEFKTSGTITQAVGTEDSNFRKFQKFITRYSRMYNNLEEFEIRYGLFSNIANKFKNYNYGDDLVGINLLSDRTFSEKRAFFG